METNCDNDFPVDWEEDQYVTRREFFKFVTLASGGVALGSVGMAAWTVLPREERLFEPARIATVDQISAGQSLPFSYPRPNDLCLLVRKEDGSFVAYSRRCTHLSCPVDYQPEKNRLYCPCHNGAFSVENGRVLQGPPPHPLPQIKLEILDGTVWAIGVLRGEV